MNTDEKTVKSFWAGVLVSKTYRERLLADSDHALCLRVEQVAEFLGLTVTLRFEAGPEALWPLVQDHELFCADEFDVTSALEIAQRHLLEVVGSQLLRATEKARESLVGAHAECLQARIDKFRSASG